MPNLIPQEERARSVVLACNCDRQALGSDLCWAHIRIAAVIEAALQAQAETFRAVEASP
jgi:hypothetical protein